MRGKFNHIARVVRTARENHPKRLSQAEVSHLMGYLNGQFISNVERGKCSVPVKKVADLSLHLGIQTAVLKEAMMKDFSESFDAEVENRFKQLNKEPLHDATVNAH